MAILAWIRVELRLARDGAEIVVAALELALRSCGVGVDRHPADRVDH